MKLWMLCFVFDMSERSSEDMSERMPENMSEEMSERISKDMSERTSSQSAKLRVTERISGDELCVYPHLTRSG